MIAKRRHKPTCVFSVGCMSGKDRRGSGFRARRSFTRNPVDNGVRGSAGPVSPNPTSGPRRPNPSFVRVAQNYRPMLMVMCPSAATESNILFSFETDLLRRMKLDWSNRAASVAPLCIRFSSARQESHRRAADGHFHPSSKTGRDWPVMPTNRTERECTTFLDRAYRGPVDSG